MPPNKSSASTDKSADEVAIELYPYIRQFKDGRVERFVRTSFVPASEDPAAGNGVATRDVVIDRATGVSARLFLPAAAAATGRRLPVVMYIRGGTFCTESAFSKMYHRYGTSLAARAGALVVSIDYRLAPEHPIPAAYEDAWTALQWVASMSDDWLANHGDPKRIFIAGDSAGGNIVYQTAVRAGRAGDGVDLEGVDLEGVALVHPYFWGDKRLPAEAVHDGVSMFTPEFVEMVWPFVSAGKAGNDDPRLNPSDEEIASLKCRRALVAVASKDIFRHRGRRVAARMRDSPWIGDNVTLVVSEGEDHAFHLHGRPRATTEKLMESIVQFINQSPTTAREGKKTSTSEADRSARPDILGAPTRSCENTLGNGMHMKPGGETARYVARSSL